MSRNMPKTFTGPSIFGSVKIFRENIELTGYILTDGQLQFQFFCGPQQKFTSLVDVWHEYTEAARKRGASYRTLSPPEQEIWKRIAQEPPGLG